MHKRENVYYACSDAKSRANLWGFLAHYRTSRRVSGIHAEDASLQALDAFIADSRSPSRVLANRLVELETFAYEALLLVIDHAQFPCSCKPRFDVI